MNILIKTFWTIYDLEAILEYAIIYILKHIQQVALNKISLDRNLKILIFRLHLEFIKYLYLGHMLITSE